MEAKAEAEARQQSAAGARKPAIKSRSNANTNTNSNTHSGSRTPTARSASQSKALPMATQRASFTGTARSSSSSNSSKSSVSANTSKSSSSKSSISNSISRRASYSCNSSSTARVPPSTPSVTVTGAMPRARPATSNSSSNNSNIRKSTEARKSSASSSKSKSLVQSSAAANAASKSRAKQQSSAAASASETNSNGKESRLPALPQSEVKAADEVRLDLRGHKLRSLDSGALNLSPNLEFVYLRDNKLSSLIGIEILKKVKVLDLSFNEFKGTGFEPLENCKGLQQLYLAGNQITSLSGLPELPNLEFLSVAQNKLKSLVMASQPRLQVLAASKNKISTLKGFPYLPMLEHLRLEENPILEMPHLEAAAILLVGVTLKKFNDRDISADEKKLAKQCPAHTSLCIRDGWDFCGPEKASDSTMDFLLSKWKCNLPPGYLIKKAAVEQPFEEDACKCHFVFMKDRNMYEETELTLRYQWFISEKTPMSFEKIPGAVNDVYWPKREEIDKHLKVECTPVLREVEYSPIFAVSAPVAPGTGCPKVLSLRIEGDLIEGNLIKGFAEVAWCGGTPSKGVASWLRRKWNSSPVVISGAEDEEYRLTFDDVDCSLVFMYTPVTKEGRKGEPQYAMTEFVKAAFPSVSNVQVIGDPVEGKLLKGVGTYFGGEEGPSKFEWFREDRESGQLVPISSGASEYMLTEDDIGCSLRFVYTPVNLEGLEGNPSTVTTAIISRAPPRVNHLHIIGDLCEGSKVVISATVKCAIEGASRVQWFKTNSRDVEQGESGLEAISSSKVAKAFRIPLSAVGHYLVAKYTPVAQDGESGEPALVITDKRVESLPPSLSFLSISGDFKEGETLTASYGYFGGHEGNSEYNWYLHQDENDPGTLINEAVGHLQYQITNDAVYKFISFKCIPIRDDGVVGECRSTMSHERVQPAFPRILSLQIVGECVEGQKLSIEKKYWGGDEGASRIQWFLTHEDGMQTEIKGATISSYVLCKYDIGGLVSVSYEPVRNDGTKGTIAYSSFSGPVLAGPPSCDSLELHGEAVEGGCLSFSAVYSGGEQGNCFHEWIQQGSNGRLEHLTNDDILELTHEDVGSRIELVFTPVRKDGCTGRSQKILSDIIGEAEPVGIDLVIPLCCEDQEVVPEKSYYGGTEGSGQYTWYRVYNDISDSQLSDLNDMKEMKILSNSRTYIPTLEDVGSYLALRWVPTRKDGKVGKPLVAKSRLPVSAAPPRVCNVHISEASSGVYVGKGEYYGGVEGNSQHNWYRSKENGTMILIPGANSNSYHVSDDDYACQISFGYLPVRSDGEVGELCLSEPSNVILPEMPQVQKIVLTGKAVEGEKLTAVEVILNSDLQKTVWDKYKKDVKYQWSRSPDAGPNELFEPLLSHCSCSYKVGLEDVGFWLQCECVLTDVFGRCSGPVSAKIGPVLPGIPKVEKLEIQGKGYHTNLYAVQGTYSGGKEGKSRIQWFRSMVGSPDLISIPGKVDATYEANVDDVGYQLVVRYTPARDDCLEGIPVFTSTEPICVEPDILKEVKQKLELGAVKFEVLRDRDHSPRKSQAQALGSLEKRILDVNRKRLKVIKPGSKTSFPNTEIRGTYAPPFHVELIPNDQHRLKIVIDSESEVDLMVHTRHMRDVIVLVLRGLAQRFNSTSLISLLKM